MIENLKSSNRPQEKALTEQERKELYSIREKYFNHLQMNYKDENTLKDLDKLYPPTENKDELIEQIDDLKKCLDSFRPFDKDQLKNLEEYYTVAYTYESNRIEGNSLTQSETHLVINEGLTIGGKPLKDHLEAINHKEAYQYIQELVERKIEISEREVLNIHALILRMIDKDNAGRYRNLRIQVGGSKYVFPEPYMLRKLMEDMFIWYEENKNKIHPVLLAGEMHERLVTIHPFIDGNGRTSRLLMNLILLQNGFPIINISGEKKERKEYYNCLETAQINNDKSLFTKFILQQEKKSLFDYLNMYSGNITKTDKGYYFFKKIETLLKQK